MHTWLPQRLRPGESGPVVDWCALPDSASDGPFFDANAGGARGQTRSAALADLSAAPHAVLPNGLIFHVSRCGSTLLAQQLAALPGCRVLSEPPILESLLRLPGLDPHERRVRLHALLAAFAAGAPRATVVKSSARALLDHATLRAAAPAVPRVVLYREPAEVLVALVGRSTQVPPGLSAAGLLDADDPAQPLGAVEFWARVLARQYAAARELAAVEGTLLLAYEELPDAAGQRVAAHFGLALSAAERAAMQAAAARNAKSGAPFADDRARKRAAMTDAILAAAERWVAPHFALLESRRSALAQRR